MVFQSRSGIVPAMLSISLFSEAQCRCFTTALSSPCISGWNLPFAYSPIPKSFFCTLQEKPVCVGGIEPFCIEFHAPLGFRGWSFLLRSAHRRPNAASSDIIRLLTTMKCSVFRNLLFLCAYHNNAAISRFKRR